MNRAVSPLDVVFTEPGGVSDPVQLVEFQFPETPPHVCVAPKSAEWEARRISKRRADELNAGMKRYFIVVKRLI